MAAMGCAGGAAGCAAAKVARVLVGAGCAVVAVACRVVAIVCALVVIVCATGAAGCALVAVPCAFVAAREISPLGSLARLELRRVRDVVSALLQEHGGLGADEQRLAVQREQRLFFRGLVCAEPVLTLLIVQVFETGWLRWDHRRARRLPERCVVEQAERDVQGSEPRDHAAVEVFIACGEIHWPFSFSVRSCAISSAFSSA